MIDPKASIGDRFGGHDLSKVVRDASKRADAKTEPEKYEGVNFANQIQENELAWTIRAVMHEGAIYTVELSKTPLDFGRSATHDHWKNNNNQRQHRMVNSKMHHSLFSTLYCIGQTVAKDAVEPIREFLHKELCEGIHTDTAIYGHKVQHDDFDAFGLPGMALTGLTNKFMSNVNPSILESFLGSQDVKRIDDTYIWLTAGRPFFIESEDNETGKSVVAFKEESPEVRMKIYLHPTIPMRALGMQWTKVPK